MKVVYPVGMLALVGLVFLAMGAPSASARVGDVTAAETHANATIPAPAMSAPGATPLPVPPMPGPAPTPFPSADVVPIGTASEVSLVRTFDPVTGDLSIPAVPPPEFPQPVTVQG